MTMSSLYSALVIDPRWDPPLRWQLFDYGLSQCVDGTPTLATRVHTNVPRQGTSGLPMGWDAVIDHWRALASIRFAEPVLEWAGACDATLSYDARVIDRRPLLDLLFGSQSTHGQTLGRALGAPLPTNRHERPPLWIRENLSYGVRIECAPAATAKLQRWLVEHTQDYQLIVWVFLEGIVRTASP